ncbi:hypothetical protein M5K25_010752 [Dendrobium thyrsiflorum]|uniref:Uncharacterized protein n=1 Tax=Dendrobium thyrsiflorum TaxID=117978 RepID=A0ABD0V226_DENTH
MEDPDVDHGFLYDDQGRVDILGSPFFDVEFGNDRTADEYVDRIIYQLSLAIEDRIPSGRWYIISAPPTPDCLMFDEDASFSSSLAMDTDSTSSDSQDVYSQRFRRLSNWILDQNLASALFSTVSPSILPYIIILQTI